MDAIAVSEKKKLLIKKYPDTCGRGLKQGPKTRSIVIRLRKANGAQGRLFNDS